MLSNTTRISNLLGRPEPLTWLFAGDSIAQGALHTMGWRDFTELFRERVRWEMQRRSDCVLNTAVSGWRVGNLNDDLEWSILRHRPDVVFVHVGMNDCAAGPEGLEQFRAGYQRLIASMRMAGVGDIVVQTPNRIMSSDTLRFAHLPSYAAAIREIAARDEVALIDHFTAWEPAEKSGRIAYWLSDSCHPNECGHRANAHQIFRELGVWDDTSYVCRLFVP